MTSQWYSFTASFGKMYGKSKQGSKILQTDIDVFVQNVVMKQIVAFKIVETTGVWKGQKEDSFDIVVLDKNFEKMQEIMKEICSQYTNMFYQDAVMLVYEKVDAVEFIEKRF
ncbi:Hypothetical predicted protein [Paramuricea clavata]|uniref:Uncharacterized protein n=1 Tax=Paramuricea clavata TaxID=317549 RepID=A0A6S7H1P1_PARCT|nr:Hypothetical predicted protein [Paramuricea clavata]